MNFQYKIWFGFFISLLSLSIAGYTGYLLTQKLIDTSYWVAHTYEVETLIESVESLIKDAETGQRGYLLTGESTYLEPYENGILKIDIFLAKAKTMTIDNPIQQMRIGQIELLTDKKLNELQETIELYNTENLDLALEIILTNRGKQIMDDIRYIIHDMRLEEKKLLAARKQEFKSAIRSATFITSIGFILTFSLIVSIIIYIGRDTNRYIAARNQKEQKLKYIATHDPLTGLYNRNVLERQLNDEIHRASRYKHDLSIFMLDIDHFKSINDTYGHQAGDKVLLYFSKEIENSIRNSDYAARYGGEEFIIILPETTLSKAEELAERLRKHIAEFPFTVEDGKDISLTASIGIATFPEHAQTSKNLIVVSDMAMYAAKKAGRNQIKSA
jgi:diguanylate cyclase (GGDEF)-like protein